MLDLNFTYKGFKAAVKQADLGNPVFGFYSVQASGCGCRRGNIKS